MVGKSIRVNSELSLVLDVIVSPRKYQMHYSMLGIPEELLKQHVLLVKNNVVA